MHSRTKSGLLGDGYGGPIVALTRQDRRSVDIDSRVDSHSRHASIPEDSAGVDDSVSMRNPVHSNSISRRPSRLQPGSVETGNDDSTLGGRLRSRGYSGATRNLVRDGEGKGDDEEEEEGSSTGIDRNGQNRASLSKVRRKMHTAAQLRNSFMLHHAGGSNNTNVTRGYHTHVFRHIFRIETEQEEDDDMHDHMYGLNPQYPHLDTQRGKGLDKDACCCLRRAWQRMAWRSMRQSHELLAIFLAQRRPGMGVSERMVLFVGCLESQLMGITLMFFLHSCYSMSSIFEEDSLPIASWIEARVYMMAIATLFSVREYMVRMFIECENIHCSCPDWYIYCDS